MSFCKTAKELTWRRFGVGVGGLISGWGWIIIIKMSEIITDLVTPVAVSSEEMTYSNRVYLSPLGKIPPQKRFIKLKGYVLPTAFA